MPLAPNQSEWIVRFTLGKVQPPGPASAGGQAAPNHRDQLLNELRMRQARERIDEQALKEVMVAKAIAKIDAHKEKMREAFDMKVTTVEDGKETEQNVRDAKGKQQKAFDAAEANKLKEAPKGLGTAMVEFTVLVTEADILAAEKVERSHINDKAGVIVVKRERLFTDDEIQEELFTPLVRELVLPETLIPDKYSATQKMIDGSNEHYIKECRNSGKAPATGAVEFAKGAVNLASSIAGTVLAGMAPVAAGKDAMATSGALSKQEVATAQAMTTGIAALLTGAIDAADQINDFRSSGDFSAAGFKQVMSSVALGIGKVVAGATGDSNLGLVITDSINAATSVGTMTAKIVEWRRNGGPPPIADIISGVGDTLAASFSAKSDQTADSNTSTGWGQAGAIVGAAFNTAAKAYEKKLITAFQNGDWNAVFEVIATAGTQAAKAVPTAVQYAAQYNAIDGSDPNNPNLSDAEKKERQFQEQQKLIKATATLGDETDKLGDKVTALGGMLNMKATTVSDKQMAEIEKKFAARQAAMQKDAEQAQAEELKSIEKQLETERKAYQESLLCLGSTNPDDAQYKSIAKLVAQLERDRAIWNGINAMFGAGLGIASSVAGATTVAVQVVPALKAAGQLVKFVANLKAAADRLSAFLDWKESRKDAESAVSPYATSVENFCANQGTQFTHYTIQATANIIQALLAAGEMSPFSPAFAAAGGAVSAAAAAEELVYKFHKQQALRTAWSRTKEALEPKNKGNRKMALLVREINPTLAKYTIAYGALIERSPIAITAMNRIGLDRETLTRAGDGVSEVKNYLEKLYVDDNVVVGKLDVAAAVIQVPAPALSTRAWSMSCLMWAEKGKMATPNPPEIIANLALVEKPLKARAGSSGASLDAKQLRALHAALGKLYLAFANFDPRTENGVKLKSAKETAENYADLAYAAAAGVEMDLDALKAEDPVAA